MLKIKYKEKLFTKFVFISYSKVGMENITIDFLERNSTNNNTTEYYINEHLKNARNILPIFTVIITMIAIGADVSWNQIYTGIRKPIGPAIGLFCQFIIMPLIGFLYNIIFQFESSVAAGLLIISCCPGGTVSNMFTYYLDGDVSLRALLLLRTRCTYLFTALFYICIPH
ncbi:solute carrier family 10 member 6-like [Centruroides sculpturatus]|uniref:solute carrier family 10 member 6-like n=1 Tax=Centruroides sculpturatus TaxID=218467 RepID=UPI000C6CF882|nr:solute carrier family 10 member 6-like [Centruroides sculpturatus]